MTGSNTAQTLLEKSTAEAELETAKRLLSDAHMFLRNPKAMGTDGTTKKDCIEGIESFFLERQAS